MAGLCVLACAGPAQAGTLLTASQSGGIAGVDEQVTISNGGLVTRQSRGGSKHRSRLSKKRLGVIKRHVRKADFAHLRKTYGNQNCSDAFVFQVEHDGHAVTVIQCGGGSGVPSALRAVLTDVGKLLG